MTYKETIDFMYSQLPMFHRVGKAAYKNNLDNAQALDKLCNYPHRNYRTIHIAGTNGKGSVSHMLASVLQTAGYKTGLFTSPHLVDFRERIRVNGKMIPETEVAGFISSFKEAFEEIKPSFFEMTSALAFYYFNKEEVDFAIIETGLGGRLDSTNIISPELSVITNIGFDHVEILGDTLAKIAAEKAGIIKPNIPVVVGEWHAETSSVFIDTAKKNHSEITFADKIYAASYKTSDFKTQTLQITHLNAETLELKLDLLGRYQLKNVCTVLSAIDILSRRDIFINPKNLELGLANVSYNTGLKGRWQIISEKPLIICDTGHNFDGISYVVNQLSQLQYEKLHFIFGVVNDKDISNILPLLPKDAEYYFTKAEIPRALNEKELSTLANSVGLCGSIFENVKKALENAKKNAAPNDLIFIGGSTFIVADALKELEKN